MGKLYYRHRIMQLKGIMIPLANGLKNIKLKLNNFRFYLKCKILNYIYIYIYKFIVIFDVGYFFGSSAQLHSSAKTKWGEVMFPPKGKTTEIK